MALKCGVCGHKEHFRATAELKLDLRVDCDGVVVSHDLEEVLSQLSLKPESCGSCGSRSLIESDYISDKEWESQIDQVLEQRRLEEKLDELQSRRSRVGRRAS